MELTEAKQNSFSNVFQVLFPVSSQITIACAPDFVNLGDYEHRTPKKLELLHFYVNFFLKLRTH